MGQPGHSDVTGGVCGCGGPKSYGMLCGECVCVYNFMRPKEEKVKMEECKFFKIDKWDAECGPNAELWECPGRFTEKEKL